MNLLLWNVFLGRYRAIYIVTLTVFSVHSIALFWVLNFSRTASEVSSPSVVGFFIVPPPPTVHRTIMRGESVVPVSEVEKPPRPKLTQPNAQPTVSDPSREGDSGNNQVLAPPPPEATTLGAGHSQQKGYADSPISHSYSGLSQMPIEVSADSVRYLRPPQISYPVISRRFGEQGRVVLRVLVDAQGYPQDITVHQPSAYSRLNAQAVEAMRDARFEPYRQNGRAMAVFTLAPIVFKLESAQ